MKMSEALFFAFYEFVVMLTDIKAKYRKKNAINILINAQYL